MSIQWETLCNASPALKGNADFVRDIVAGDGRALCHASPQLRQDKGLVLVAVVQNGRALEYAVTSLRRDKEVVLAAVVENGFALRHASESLQQHPFLQRIGITDLPLEASKLRLALASCLLPRHPSNGGLGLSVLSGDVVELTAARVSPDVVAGGLACRHHYWCSVPADAAVSGPPSPYLTRSKKRKAMATGELYK